MANKEKGFNFKFYAIAAVAGVAAILVVICVTTFRSRYVAFHPEELAKTYVDTIVQKGDGYNAYKNTIASKSVKYGDFIRVNYMYPIIYSESGYEPGDDTDGMKGLNDESYMGEKTKEDNGKLAGEVIDTMYPYYEELINAHGWDNYNAIYTNYFAKLVEVREEVFGDKYMTDEIMFTALESNVTTYGENLTGTEDEFDPNTGVQLKVKSTGAYEEAYGEDYKLTVETGEVREKDLDTYKESIDKDAFETYGVSADDISEVKSIAVDVKNQDGEVVAEIEVIVVKIGMSWYVDNTVTDTGVLYNFYK